MNPTPPPPEPARPRIAAVRILTVGEIFEGMVKFALAQVAQERNLDAAVAAMGSQEHDLCRAILRNQVELELRGPLAPIMAADTPAEVVLKSLREAAKRAAANTFDRFFQAIQSAQ